MNVTLNSKTFEKKIKNNTTVYVAGYCFFNGNLLNRESFLELFFNVKDFNSFYNLLIQLDGLYSIIVITNNKVFVAVDPLRSFPIFYLKDEKFNLTDDPYYFFKVLKKVEYDYAKVEEFISLSFTQSQSTLFKNIFQLDSGQCLEFNLKEKELNTKYYRYHISNKRDDSSVNEIFKKAFNVSKNVFKRLLQTTEGKTIVVPLSGGYDSRYIVAMLKEFKYKNVICFTYGRKDSDEVIISKKVAEKLNYKWIFIEYSEEIVKEYIQTTQFNECMFFSSKLSSTPHFQDYIAVKYLKDNNLIPTDSIFVPGHSGDLLGGSHLRSIVVDYKDKCFSEIEDILQSTYEYWYKYNEFNNKSNINISQYKEDIESFYKSLSVIDSNYITYISDSWNIANRQSKFIVNSCQVYRYFNYDFRLPLFDQEMVEFWLSIKPYYRTNHILYNDFLLNHLFNKYNIAFVKENDHSYLKKKLKKVIGESLYKKIKKYLKNDNNNFNYFIKYMLIDIGMDEKYLYSHIDNVSSIWYLKKLNKEMESLKNAK
ncbi:MAG: asparagine synthase C-terminal domain-containing protein [Sulfurimonas sp.]|uniref:asparagine synthase C-terminal domain-containing protein n=1 Tax=Sulfurimonas sp. TaxID=2022749 RepID=UPI0025D2703D|nr:asparagine synthase C-terminal domain-containing protein [Sulfurimonas sp.]MCK9491391.1 asparagine synthase C-terminal domain-containing protein [Sulfurimonas sp.]